MSMPGPAFHPDQRDPAQVAPAHAYQRHDAVWVHRDGVWHSGVVDGVSAFAVLVTYQRAGSRGTVVDTVTPEFVVPHDLAERRDHDPAGGDR
jgi:hypothetical protein